MRSTKTKVLGYREVLRNITLAITTVILFFNIQSYADSPLKYQRIIENNCLSCHDAELKKGDLNLEDMSWDLNDKSNTRLWTLIHDRVLDGEMPPKKKNGKERISKENRKLFIESLSKEIVRVENKVVEKRGRSQVRRLTRFEYQNTLRDLLDMPTLEVSESLPVDGKRYGFDKVGAALDLSHAHLETYLDVAEATLRKALAFSKVKPKVSKKRYYARAQSAMTTGHPNAIWDRWWLRLNDLEVSNAKSDDKEKESVAVFRGAKVPFDYFFNGIRAPYTGKYKLTLNARSVMRKTEMADVRGPKPALDPSGRNKYLSPVKDEAFAGKRPEPVALYARGKKIRYLDCVEVPTSAPERKTIECYLNHGESIGVDTVRLPKPMVPAIPLKVTQLDPDGYPGVAFHWIELEGPFVEAWPPKAYTVLFDNLPFQSGNHARNQIVRVKPKEPLAEGKRLIERFMSKVYRRKLSAEDSKHYQLFFEELISKKVEFTNAIIETYATILSSPKFLFMHSGKGELDEDALLERLSLFLTDAIPDEMMKSSLSHQVKQESSPIDLNKGLVAHWPLKSDDLNNVTNKKYNGVGMKGVEFDKQTQSFFFDGKGDYIKVPHDSDLDPSEAITVACWVKYDSFKTIPHQITKIALGAGSQSGGFALWTHPSGTVTFSVKSPAETGATSKRLKTGTWYHLVGTYDRKYVKLYINGVEAARKAMTAPMKKTEADFVIGARGDLKHFHHGAINDVRVYKRALNKTEINNLYGAKQEDGLKVSELVDSLLASEKSIRFIDSFTEQWLRLDEINATDPDRDLYPTYTGDDWLVRSMVQESKLFLRYMLKNNLPIKRLVDSDTIFANEVLAKHYGVKDVVGPAMRRIPLPKDSPYGGVMTQASVLKVTANGTSTSPVLRGVWVADKLIGVRIPKPPANIEGVEPDIRGASTIREILAKHKNNISCASCHEKFDAYGFALENFNVMGEWTENYRTSAKGNKRTGVGRGGRHYTHFIGQKIDASHELPGGKKFKNIYGLKKLLLEDDRQIARNFVNRLVVYATGAEVQLRDREEVEKILDRCRSSNYGLRTMIHEIVQSPLFRNK